MSEVLMPSAEAREVFLAGLRVKADEREEAGDVKGWILAMRRLAVYSGWGGEVEINPPPDKIVVSPVFYQTLLEFQRGREPNNNIATSDSGLMFRRVAILPRA